MAFADQAPESCPRFLPLVFDRSLSLKEVQTHVRHCQDCTQELQEAFASYQTYPELDDLPRGIESADQYLQSLWLSVRHSGERMEHVSRQLDQKLDEPEVVTALMILFQVQYRTLVQVGLDNRGTEAREFMLKRLSISLAERYGGLREHIGVELFNFLVTGDPDNTSGFEQILEAWKRICEIEE